LNYFNYFSEIEETFVRRRGRNLFLSPLDWALIETWQERQIPLHIVLRGIEKVFDTADKQPARKRSVKSLMYCREEIEAQHAEWLESQTGKNGSETVVEDEQSLFSNEAIENHLTEAESDLKTAAQKANGDLRETLERVLNRLAELKTNFQDAENLEESLGKLDDLLDASLLQHFAAEDVKDEIKKQLAAYRSKMEAEVYRHTFDLMLLKRLRGQAQVPRLSLFYL
jgi:hypothetical protein